MNTNNRYISSRKTSRNRISKKKGSSRNTERYNTCSIKSVGTQAIEHTRIGTKAVGMHTV